jgi:hypothetical protein
MSFYIQLERNDKIFRFQKDKNWRILENLDFQDTDFITDLGSELMNIQTIDSEMILEGITWEINPTSSTLFADDNVLNYQIYKRCVELIIPSKEQLISVVAKGDDSKTNFVILGDNGLYSLHQFDNFNFSYEYPNIVVRNEAFIEGNGYVGFEASTDKSFINDLYLESLEYWLIHLQKGKTNMFSDGSMNRRIEEDILVDIQTVISSKSNNISI